MTSRVPGHAYHLLCLLPATDKCPTWTRYVTSEVFKNATTAKELKSFLFLQQTEEEEDKQALTFFQSGIHLNERKLKPSLELVHLRSSLFGPRSHTTTTFYIKVKSILVHLHISVISPRLPAPGSPTMHRYLYISVVTE